MRKEEVDPITYIESAFLDVEKPKKQKHENDLAVIEAEFEEPPAFTRKYGSALDAPQPKETATSVVEAIRKAREAPEKEKPVKLKATNMKAPRPRRRKTPSDRKVIAPESEQIWQQLPKNLKFLAGVYDDNVTQKYYTTDFKESREELIMRMVDPQLNLEETARLLGVCPATVRRYTNRGWLQHHRTSGNQRRFKLSGIVNFVEQYGRNPD